VANACPVNRVARGTAGAVGPPRATIMTLHRTRRMSTQCAATFAISPETR
jgi:hypothetical protein